MFLVPTTKGQKSIVFELFEYLVFFAKTLPFCVMMPIVKQVRALG